MRSHTQLFLKAALLVVGVAPSALTGCGARPRAAAADGAIAGDVLAIIGGADLTSESPFSRVVAGLVDRDSGRLCTAVILSEQLLLTAAHCVEGDPKRMEVRFGPMLWKYEIEKREITAVALHPVWTARRDQTIARGDIALVRFNGGLPAGYHGVDIETGLAATERYRALSVLGYGATSGVAGKETGGPSGQLRSVELKISDQGLLRGEFLVDQRNGQGVCRGDSGGPALALSAAGAPVVVGIVSAARGKRRDICSGDGIFTSVPAHSDWIIRTRAGMERVSEADQH